jgi:hypothetical protein
VVAGHALIIPGRGLLKSLVDPTIAIPTIGDTNGNVTSTARP